MKVHLGDHMNVICKIEPHYAPVMGLGGTGGLGHGSVNPLLGDDGPSGGI